jgi:hypothetical protein
MVPVSLRIHTFRKLGPGFKLVFQAPLHFSQCILFYTTPSATNHDSLSKSDQSVCVRSTFRSATGGRSCALLDQLLIRRVRSTA